MAFLQGPCAVNLSSLLPDCAALSSVAGVRSYFYAARLSDLNITFAADGSISSIALKTGGKFAKFDGIKFQNSGATELSTSAIGKSRWKQTWNYRAYSRTQADKNTLQMLGRVQDLVVIAPNNDSQVEVYGATAGLAPASAKGGTGIKLDDDNTFLLAFDGEEPTVPPLYTTAVVVLATSAATATTASTSLPVVSATGITLGQVITGAGITAGTTVTAIAGTTLTLSAPATVPASTALSLTTPDQQAFAANITTLDALVNA